MKSLYDKIIECGEIFATPGNTLGMGNPGFDGEYVSEPISPAGKPATEKPAKLITKLKNHKRKKLTESYINENGEKILGSGSEGVVYDCGNYIKKVLFAPEGGDDDIYKHNTIKIVDRWANTKGLKVIPEIIKWDKKNLTYTLPKFKINTPKTQLLHNALWKALFDFRSKSWKSTNIDRFTQIVTDKETQQEFKQWFKDFEEDFNKILGPLAPKISEDIKLMNLGEDKDGKIWCFDWYDPFCSKI